MFVFSYNFIVENRCIKQSWTADQSLNINYSQNIAPFQLTVYAYIFVFKDDDFCKLEEGDEAKIINNFSTRVYENVRERREGEKS